MYAETEVPGALHKGDGALARPFDPNIGAAQTPPAEN
jgi:hypothetical protein